MDAATFDRISLQGHPFRFSLNSEDVVANMAETISRIDFAAHHAAREARIKELIWQDTLRRMECYRNRDGQIPAQDIPRYVTRKGDDDLIDVVQIDHYIEYRLHLHIEKGMKVFQFWNDDVRVYAATLIDFLHRDGEVIDWHVEMYVSRKAANAEINRREREISKRMATQ